MTYIELFDETAIENLCSSLAQVPDKVIFIGKSSKKMQKAIDIYNEVFCNSIDFDYRCIIPNHLDNIVEVLSNIIEECDECCFDVTGGNDLLLVAVGIVAERYKDSNIQIHRFNLSSRKIYDCDGDGSVMNNDEGEDFSNKFPCLSVENNIKIYGGIVKKTETPPDDTYSYYVDKLWNVCKRDPANWNFVTGILFDHCVNRTMLDDNGLEFRFTVDINKYGFTAMSKLLNSISNFGLIDIYECDDITNVINLSFRNEFIKKCLTKQGQVLEYKIYFLVKNAEINGTKVFNDVQTGVEMQWDEILGQQSAEVINEVDVIAMHNLIPVFISCKNGQITTDELYKLNSVANKFGKKYSKKVLVMNDIYKMNSSGTKKNYSKEYKSLIRARAKDLGISVIENCYRADDQSLTKALINYQSDRKFGTKNGKY